MLTLFDSCQLTITRMSTIKFNTDCICLGHLASIAQSYLQDNNVHLAANQSVRAIVAIQWAIPENIHTIPRTALRISEGEGGFTIMEF